MHDPDPKCRHFGILWHLGIFAKKSDRKSDLIFPILSDFFPIFRLFPTFPLSDSTSLMRTHWCSLKKWTASTGFVEQTSLCGEMQFGIWLKQFV